MCYIKLSESFLSAHMTSFVVIFNTTHFISLWLTSVFHSVNCNSQILVCMPLWKDKNLSAICKVKKKNQFCPAANSI